MSNKNPGLTRNNQYSNFYHPVKKALTHSRELSFDELRKKLGFSSGKINRILEEMHENGKVNIENKDSKRLISSTEEQFDTFTQYKGDTSQSETHWTISEDRGGAGENELQPENELEDYDLEVNIPDPLYDILEKNYSNNGLEKEDFDSINEEIGSRSSSFYNEFRDELEELEDVDTEGPTISFSRLIPRDGAYWAIDTDNPPWRLEDEPDSIPENTYVLVAEAGESKEGIINQLKAEKLYEIKEESLDAVYCSDNL